MGSSEISAITEKDYDKQLSLLKEVAVTSVDTCILSQFIALSDARVRDKILEKSAAGFPFRGIYCLRGMGIPENKQVVFDFMCPPGTFCLIPPAFMVDVNFVDRFVGSIVDPFYPPTGKDESCGCKESITKECQKDILEGGADITIKNGKACLRVKYAGNVCINVPNSIPNGTVATADVDVCKEFGITCGVEVVIKVLGEKVASRSWGCC
ncbi:MAG: hypothetical protein ACKVH8_14890 [Pirellulales bacterium]